MFNGDVRFNVGDRRREVNENGVALAVVEFGPDPAVLHAAELFDIPHGSMHRTDLPFELGEEIELKRDESLGLLFKTLYLRRPNGLIVHGPSVTNLP